MAKTPIAFYKPTFKIFRVKDNVCLDSTTVSWVDSKFNDGYASVDAAESALVKMASYETANATFWFDNDFEIRKVYIPAPLPPAPEPVKMRTMSLAQKVSIVKTIK